MVREGPGQEKESLQRKNNLLVTVKVFIVSSYRLVEPYLSFYPEYIASLYFEKQDRGCCVIHSINNCLQQRLLTSQDMNHAQAHWFIACSRRKNYEEEDSLV
jgi:hypothetical protein